MSKLIVWEHPDSYAGFSPDGDYILVSKHRDSGTLDRSNYVRIYADMHGMADSFPEPEDGDEYRTDWVYTWRASHWAVGWIDYVMLRHDAPKPLIDKAEAIMEDLADYPVYDEDHWSGMEYEEVMESWENMSLRDRIGMCVEYGYSKFAARAKNPYDADLDCIIDILRE